MNAVARIARSVAFAFTGDFNRAGREFAGGLIAPLIAGTCLTGSLISCGAYLIDKKHIFQHVQMRHRAHEKNVPLD